MVYLIAFLAKSIFMIAAVAFIIFVPLLAFFTILTIIATMVMPFHKYWHWATNAMFFNSSDIGFDIIFWCAMFFIMFVLVMLIPKPTD